MLGLCPADEVRLMAGVGADAFDLAVVAGVEEPTDEQRRKYGSALSMRPAAGSSQEALRRAPCSRMRFVIASVRAWPLASASIAILFKTAIWFCKGMLLDGAGGSRGSAGGGGGSGGWGCRGWQRVEGRGRLDEVQREGDKMGFFFFARI